MLVLSRKAEEAVRIGRTTIVRILKIRGKHVTIGIEADREVTITRTELALGPADEPEPELAEAG